MAKGKTPAAGAPPELLDADHQLLYRGASGQFAVLSEFLYRLVNVAVPEVDVGEDAFVIRANDETVTRVQVKHATAEEQVNGSHGAQFNLPWDQLHQKDEPALVYVLAIRYKEHWSDFLVIRRPALRQLQDDQEIGTVNLNSEGQPAGLKLRLVFSLEDVRAKSGVSLQAYRGAFTPWPPPTA